MASVVDRAAIAATVAEKEKWQNSSANWQNEREKLDSRVLQRWFDVKRWSSIGP